MIVYITVGLLAVFLLLISTVPALKKYERLLISFCFFVIWIVVSFSSYVGPDYESYKFMYDLQNENFFLQEFMFRQLGILFKKYNLSFSVFYFSLTSIYIISLYFVFLRYRNIAVLNLLIFITMPYGLIEGGFNYLRQNVAVALFYLSILYLSRNHFLRYSIFNFVGILFHKSAFVLLPLYFLLKIRLSIRKYLLSFIFLFFATLSLEIPFVKNMLLMIVGSIPGYGSTYANFRNGEFLTALSIKGIFSYVYQAIPIIFLILYKRKIVITYIENILFNITYLSLITLTLALELRIMLRLEYYFILAKVFTLPLLVRVFSNNKSRTVFVLLLILYFCLYYAAIFLTGEEKKLLPYKSIFGLEVN